MAFDIEGAVKAGYSAEEIAQHLQFDYKGAVSSGYNDDEILKHLVSKNSSKESSYEKNTPQFLKDAVGGVESMARMIPNLPQMAFGEGLNTVGKYMVPDNLKQDYQELAGQATEAFPHVKPFTKSGEVADEMLGSAFKVAGRAPGAAIGGLISGQGQTGAQQQMDDPNAILPNLTESATNVAGLVYGAKALPEQVKGAMKFQFKKPVAELTKAEKFAKFKQEETAKEKAKTSNYSTDDLLAEQNNQMRRSVDLQAPQFGMRGKVPAEDLPPDSSIERPPDSFGSSRMKVDDFGQTEQGILSDQFDMNRTLQEAGRAPKPSVELPKTGIRTQEQAQGTDSNTIYHDDGSVSYLGPDGWITVDADGNHTPNRAIGEGPRLLKNNDGQNKLPSPLDLSQDVDTSNIRSPYGDVEKNSKTNVMDDTLDSTPIFDSTRIDNNLSRDGKTLQGTYRRGDKHTTINPQAIAEAWFRMSAEKKKEAGFRNLQDLQDFVEQHELEHQRDYFAGRKPSKNYLDDERRINRIVRDLQDKRHRDTDAPPINLADLPPEKPFYEGPPPNFNNTITPAQLRALLDNTERKLAAQVEKINKHNDAPDFGNKDNARLENLEKWRRIYEEQIDRLKEAIKRGIARGVSFETKDKPVSKYNKNEPISTDTLPADDTPGPDHPIFKDLRDKIYQQARNDGLSHSQAMEKVSKEAPISDETSPAYEGPAAEEPIVKTKIKGFGKKGSKGKQRGSIGFGKPKKPTIEQVAAEIGEDPKDPTVIKFYEKEYGEGINVPLTPQQQAISNIPGMKPTFSPELQPLETMIERWKTEADIEVGKVWRALRENLNSGGRMTALKTGNSFIDWNVENILGEVRRAKVIAKNVNNEIRGEVKKITGSLMNNVLGAGEGKRIFVEAMGELLRVEGTTESPHLNPKAKILADKLRKGLNDLGEKVQAELDSQGIKGFKWRPNYLAGVFFGPYRSLVKNAAGETIGVIAGRTKAEASLAVDHIKEAMPDVTFDVVEYNPKFDSGQGNLSSRYGKASEVLELLRNQSEEAARFQENLSAYYGKVQANYLGYKHHIKSKKGVFGSEGSRIWASAAENAYDLLEGQLGVIDHGYQWLAEQKIMKDMDASMTNPDIHMPEAQRYVNEYLDHAFGRTEDFVKVVDSALTLSADALGISPSSLKESLSILRNTALTSTIGVSAAFVISQGTQVLTSLPIAIGEARSNRIHGDAFGSFQKGLTEAWSHKDTLTGDAKWFHDYFTRNGTLEPNIIEHTFSKSVIPTNGMGIAGKIAAGTTNVTLATMKAVSELVGKYTIEAPEIYTRGPFVMSMAHYYRSAGLSLKEAAVRADKDASNIFVDYSPQERAMVFQRMGELGKFASTVSTFKLNNLNQWKAFISKDGSKQALAALALTTWMTTGIFGMPFSDEIEYMMRAMQGMGSDWRTPREAMLQDFPPVATFGPMSYSPELLNLPAVALHTKFNAGNVVPDDLKSMIYPLSDFYVKKITKTADYFKSGFGNREGASLAREFAPGNFKYFVDDYTSLKNKHGFIVDSNQLHDKSPDVYDRSVAETKAGKILGVVSQREYVDKQVKQQMKAAQKAWVDSTSSKVEQTVAAYRNGDKERGRMLLKEAAKYNPEAIQTIQEYLDSGAEAEAIPLNKKMVINTANSARNPHNVGVLQNFQKTQRNR